MCLLLLLLLQGDGGGESSQSIVTTSHSPVFLSNLQMIGNGVFVDAEYTNLSES